MKESRNHVLKHSLNEYTKLQEEDAKLTQHQVDDIKFMVENDLDIMTEKRIEKKLSSTLKQTAQIRVRALLKTAKGLHKMLKAETDQATRDKINAEITILAASISTIGIGVITQSSRLIKL